MGCFERPGSPGHSSEAILPKSAVPFSKRSTNAGSVTVLTECTEGMIVVQSLGLIRHRQRSTGRAPHTCVLRWRRIQRVLRPPALIVDLPGRGATRHFGCRLSTFVVN
jgi:hypothetical protein